MLLTIDGGPLFSGPDAGTRATGYDSLGRKRCAVPENRQGEIAGRSTPWSSRRQVSGGKSQTGQGSDGGEEMSRKVGVGE